MSSIHSLVPRDRYAALERCTYFNQASIGLIPVPSVEAMDTFLKQVNPRPRPAAVVPRSCRSRAAALDGSGPIIVHAGTGSVGRAAIACIRQAFQRGGPTR